jgi:hypothetical protein
MMFEIYFVVEWWWGGAGVLRGTDTNTANKLLV